MHTYKGCPCVDGSLSSLFAQRIWSRAGADVGRVTPSPGCAGSWQLSAWWEGEREVTPKPSMSRGFCAHWVSRPYWAMWIPRCWSRTLMEGSKLIPPLVSVHCPSSPLPCPDVSVYVAVYVAVCVPVCVCVHNWVPETTGKNSARFVFCHDFSSLVCSSCS